MTDFGLETYAMSAGAALRKPEFVQYYVPGWLEHSRSYASLEEAEKKIREDFKKNPYNTEPQVIMKVEKVIKVKTPEPEIQEFDFESFRQLEQKDGEDS